MSGHLPLALVLFAVVFTELGNCLGAGIRIGGAPFVVPVQFSLVTVLSAAVFWALSWDCW